MKKILIVNLVLALILLGITNQQAKADFIVDPDPGGLQFFIDGANKNVLFFTGEVGGQTSGVLVSVVPNVNVDTGNGYANITPADKKNPPLTKLTFTPVDPNLFGDFSFGGQLTSAGSVTVTVWDNQGDQSQSFTFSDLPKSANFGRLGIIAEAGSGETILKVEISSLGFKEVKQIDFSYAAVPEPATMFLLGSGLIGIGVFVRKKFRK
jgi:hypothetical protein